MEFIYKDQYHKPAEVDLERLGVEIKAGNPYAALLKSYLHIGGFKRGLPVGNDIAYSVIESFLAEFPSHADDPLFKGVRAVFSFSNVEHPADAPKYEEQITPKIANAILDQAKSGSYYAHLAGASVLARAWGIRKDIERQRNLLEKLLPNLSITDEETANAPPETDAIVLFALATAYYNLADDPRYSYRQRKDFAHTFSLYATAAANLNHVTAQYFIADYYRLATDNAMLFSEITDQKERVRRAEYFYDLALSQGYEYVKYALGKIYEASGRTEQAKAYYTELADKGDYNGQYGLAGLHHAAGEYADAYKIFIELYFGEVSDPVRVNAMMRIFEYHTGDEKPGIPRDDKAALMAAEALLDLHDRGTYRLSAHLKARADGTAHALWPRVWVRDENGLRRGRMPNRILAFAQRRKLTKDRSEKMSGDSVLARLDDFVILPENPEEAFSMLLAEARNPNAVISPDLAAELIKQRQIWVRDPKQGLSRASEPAELIKNPADFIALTEGDEDALPLLRAEAEKPGAILSVTLASELAKLTTGIEAFRWHGRAAELGSQHDMRVVFNLTYNGRSDVEQNWVEALAWSRTLLNVPAKRGGIRGGPRTEIENAQKEILAETGKPPRLWIPEGETIRPVTRQDRDLSTTEFVPADAIAAIKKYIEFAERGSAQAAQIAINLHLQSEISDQVWIMDVDAGHLRNFAVGDDPQQAIFVPSDPEKEKDFLAKRVAEAEAREIEAAKDSATRLAEEIQKREEVLAVAEAHQMEAMVLAAFKPIESAEEILDQHVMWAEVGSAIDALAAGALYHAMDDSENANRMYDLAVGHGNFETHIDVAERYAGITEGATKNIEFALHLYQELRKRIDEIEAIDEDGSLQKRLAQLHEVILDDAWIMVPKKARGGTGEDVAVPYDEPLYLFPNDDHSLGILFDYSDRSLDAAAEAIVRLAATKVSPTFCFQQLSDLLCNRKKIPPHNPLSLGPIQNPAKQARVQAAWDRLALEVVVRNVDREGNAEYHIPTDPEPEARSWIIPAASVPEYRKLLDEGRQRALAAQTNG